MSCLALAACANERLAREGTLANGDTFKEYSRIPYGYERRIYGPDGSLREDFGGGGWVDTYRSTTAMACTGCR